MSSDLSLTFYIRTCSAGKAVSYSVLCIHCMGGTVTLGIQRTNRTARYCSIIVVHHSGRMLLTMPPLCAAVDWLEWTVNVMRRSRMVLFSMDCNCMSATRVCNSFTKIQCPSVYDIVHTKCRPVDQGGMGGMRSSIVDVMWKTFLHRPHHMASVVDTKCTCFNYCKSRPTRKRTVTGNGRRRQTGFWSIMPDE